MCRNIKTLSNFEPSATDEEIRASALQYVRKVIGFTRPSRVNQEAFDNVVDEVARITRELVDALETRAEPRDREVDQAESKLGKPLTTRPQGELCSNPRLLNGR